MTTVTFYYLSKTIKLFFTFFQLLGLTIVLEFDFMSSNKWQGLQHLINSSWNKKWNSSFLMKFIWDYLRHLSWFRKTRGIFHKSTVVNRALPFLHGGSLEIRHTVTWSTDTYSVIFLHLYIALFSFKLQR